jgi:hypothetical protein
MILAPRPRAFVILDQAARPQSGIQKKLDLKLDPRPSVEDDKVLVPQPAARMTIL